jgi:hypothetical protein
MLGFKEKAQRRSRIGGRFQTDPLPPIKLLNIRDREGAARTPATSRRKPGSSATALISATRPRQGLDRLRETDEDDCGRESAADQPGNFGKRNTEPSSCAFHAVT